MNVLEHKGKIMEEKSVLNMDAEDKIVDDAMDNVSDKMVPVAAFFLQCSWTLRQAHFLVSC